MNYELELDRVVSEIKKRNARTVCIQLADALRPTAGEISEHIEKKTDAVVFIWASSCFGACDVPNLDNLHVDLLIQFGHSEWR